MNLKKANYTGIILAAEALITVWGIQSLAGFGAGNILWLAFFAAFYILYSNISRYTENIHSRLIAITAGFFSFLYTFYNSSSIKEQFDNKLFQLIVLLVVFSGLFFLFYYSVKAVYRWYRSCAAYDFMFQRKSPEAKDGNNQDISKVDINNKKIRNDNINASTKKGFCFFIKLVLSNRVFISSFVLCMIFWLPGYLYEYPGIITPDSINQIEQTLGLVQLSNHHPIAHTLLIGICLRPMYSITGNINTAIGCYTLVQMILMAFIVAYCINTLKLLGLRLRWVYLALAFYTVVPFQWVYMVTVWKDILFAGFVMLFGASFVRAICLSGDGIKLSVMILIL